MGVEELLLESEEYRKIQSRPELDGLLKAYLALAWSVSPEDAALIARAMNSDDLFSKGVIFHEKSEISNYLAQGFSEEDVRSGKAHDDGYWEAHDAAFQAQLRLYRFVSLNEYGHELPLTAIAISQPVNESLEPLWMDHLLADGWQDVDEDDIEKSIALFERYGTAYHDRDAMKQKCTELIRRCREGTYSGLPESAEHGIAGPEKQFR